ncbi:hypothetical protein BJV78DRAFT_150310 [Lactifluus subvellereus]|nr:hypothetical protein BJV78DRAFT_150310 [Lactifluus subvellereus]
MAQPVPDIRVEQEQHIRPDPNERPLLGVKLTGYRLVNMSLILAFGISNAVCTCLGQSVTPTTLDWVVGTFSAAILYWIGQFETVRPRMWPLFLHVDWAPTILEYGKLILVHPCFWFSSLLWLHSKEHFLWF